MLLSILVRGIRSLWNQVVKRLLLKCVVQLYCVIAVINLLIHVDHHCSFECTILTNHVMFMWCYLVVICYQISDC